MPRMRKAHSHSDDRKTHTARHRHQKQEKDLIRLRREAKAAKGFYVEPEAKLAFVVRIRGLNKIHPKVREGERARAIIARARASKRPPLPPPLRRPQPAIASNLLPRLSPLNTNSTPPQPLSLSHTQHRRRRSCSCSASARSATPCLCG